MKSGYLDHLAQLLQCSCLSDLRHRRLTGTEAEMLLTEPVGYPASQYVEAARYILGDRLAPLSTPAEARQSIVRHMA